MPVNKILFMIFCLFLSCSAFAVPAVVDYVIDGDTFAGVVNLDQDIKVTVRVRIINIDTPEINGRCQSEIDAAYHAKKRLQQLLPVGQSVDLQNIQDDKYLGRIDANVILPDGRDIGDVLIKEKLARPYNGGKRQSWCK